MAPRLRERYLSKILPELMKDRGYANTHQVPRLEKIVCNMGLGQAIQNPKILESAMEELAQITGQKPVATRARKAISNFKLRKGMAIGCRVTLRRDRMYEFFDRLVTVALPRVRDFKGASPRAFDGAGNYSLGIQEHAIFPEIDLDKIDTTKGLTVSICTTAKTDDEGRDLLKRMGFPFRT